MRQAGKRRAGKCLGPPALTLDKNGQPLVAWNASDGTVSNIHVYCFNY